MMLWAIVVAAAWGALLAIFAETKFGRWFTYKFPMPLVAIRITGVFVIALLFLCDDQLRVSWWQFAALFPFSAAPLLAWNFYEEYRKDRAGMPTK